MAKIDDSVKKKVPELRFKGFTDDWEERKLSDIADRFDNLRVPITASERKSGDTPYYGANGIQDYVEGFTHDGEFILVAEDGANDLKNYPVQYVNGKVWVNNHAHVLQGKNTITDNKFLMNSIKNFNIEPFLVGGGRAKLNADVMMKLNILLPTFDEQEKIGSFFKQLDDTIALHQRKLDLLKEQKKGFLQKMFPKNGSKVPELRFAGFADDWEQRKAGDIFKNVSDKGYSDLPVLSASQELGMIRRDEIGIDIKYDEASTKNYKRVQPGQFVIHLRSFQGGFAWSDIEGITSPAYTVLNYKEPNRYNSDFWKVVLTSPTFITRLETVTYGIRDGRSISYTDFSSLKLTAPSLTEQQKIGSFFKQLDDTIALHQRKLDLLKEQKKGFLQKMFV